MDNYIKLVEDLVVIKHNATVCDKAIEVSEKETTISSFATVREITFSKSMNNLVFLFCFRFMETQLK